MIGEGAEAIHDASFSTADSFSLSETPLSRVVKTTNFLQEQLQMIDSEFGLPVISENLYKRMVKLEETRTGADARVQMNIALKFFEQFPDMFDKELEGKEEEEKQKLRKEWQKNILLAIAFADIGKTGPLDATPAQVDLITAMFGVEKLGADPKTVKIEEFFTKFEEYFQTFKKNFPQSENVKELLTQLHFDVANNTMRDFYTPHSEWTYNLLKESEFPLDVLHAAAAHHRIQGDNAAGIFDENADTYTDSSGTSKRYGKMEKLITVLDVYDAMRARSMLSHDVAINGLLKKVKDCGYAEDNEFKTLITWLDTVIKAGDDPYAIATKGTDIDVQNRQKELRQKVV